MSLSSKLIKPDLKGTYPVVDYGKGVHLFDENGKRYLDACSGAIVTNIGHGVQEIIEAGNEQGRKVSFAYRTQFTNQPLEELAAMAVDKSPGADWIFFVNSGSEATEIALRFVWQYWQEQNKPLKQKVLSRRVSYHGMTLGALGVSGHYERRSRYGWVLHEEPSVAEAYCYRCPFALEPETCGLRCADDLEKQIRRIGADKVAAFIAEPVVGASGAAITPPPGYFERIREICDRYDVLLVIDEVMTGFGRTGTWFGIDHWNVKPDITVVGKGLSAGYTPIAAVLLTDAVLEPLRSGSGVSAFGHTYSGNPQSAAISLAVMKYVEEHNLVDQVRQKEHLMKHLLHQLAERHPIIGDVRGKGFLFGLELVADREQKTCFAPEWKVANRLVQIAFENGLVIYPSRGMVDLYNGDAVMVAPPFVIAEHEMQELFELLDRSLSQLELEIESKSRKGILL